GLKMTNITIARRLACSGSSKVQASNCGSSRMAVKGKSTIKKKYQAGGDHSSGDQNIVPHAGTRARRKWLRMPTAKSPVSAVSEGASHLRQRARARTTAARRTDQTGRSKSECVMLRCQVIMSNGSREKKSRKTSESGKIDPSISAQVASR